MLIGKMILNMDGVYYIIIFTDIEPSIVNIMMTKVKFLC